MVHAHDTKDLLLSLIVWAGAKNIYTYIFAMRKPFKIKIRYIRAELKREWNEG